MRSIVLLLAGVLGAHANIAEIVSATASSGAGISGTGSYAADVSVDFRLQHYELTDMPALPGLSQANYLRYSYAFTTKAPLRQIILGLGSGCAIDPQCIFGIETTAGVAGAIASYANDPGLSQDALFGISFADFPSATKSFQLSFFSNRLPGPEGRIFMEGMGGFAGTAPGAVTTPDFLAQMQSLSEEAPIGTPEPFTAVLAGGGLAALALHRRITRS